MVIFLKRILWWYSYTKWCTWGTNKLKDNTDKFEESTKPQNPEKKTS